MSYHDKFDKDEGHWLGTIFHLSPPPPNGGNKVQLANRLFVPAIATGHGDPRTLIEKKDSGYSGGTKGQKELKEKCSLSVKVIPFVFVKHKCVCCSLDHKFGFYHVS